MNVASSQVIAAFGRPGDRLDEFDVGDGGGEERDAHVAEVVKAIDRLAVCVNEVGVAECRFVRRGG
jgi:hypothetical protein